MSRCFPFPPPGYEKKLRSDDADLLKKEKHKEKKKKDKKDREKKEGKEKREKDRSDGKNREKKDRKEKHGEKKKEKDRDKGKDKSSSTSGEKRVGEQSEGYNGEKIHPREELDKEKKSSTSDEKKAAIHLSGQQGEKPVQSSIPVKETEDPKFVQELGRRIREVEKGAGSSQLVERFSVVEKKDDLAARSAVGDIRMVSEGKNKDKKADTKKMDGQSIRDQTSFVEGMVVEKHAGMAQNKIEGPTIPSDKKTERKIEEKNKSRDKENNDKRGDKRKKKDRDKKSQGKERDEEKEKKKEEKAKEKSEHKKTEKDKTKHSSKNDVVCAPSDKSTPLSNNGAETSANEEKFKKRKTVETNGFSHEDEPRPKKMPRHASSSNVLTQNGTKLEPSYQSPGLFPLERQGQVASPNNLNKEQKINGVIASSPLSLPKPKASSSIVVSVSTEKPLSATTTDFSTSVGPIPTVKSPFVTANELSASVGPAPTVKSPFVTANEFAAPLMSVSTAKPPSATSVTSISATKQPSPVDIAAAKRASVSSKKPSSSATNNQVGKAASIKPPHPDSKFLSQILSVPKMEDVSDLDDQEWLFSRKDGLLKKPPDMATTVGVDEEAPQVWAEALRLESVDIFALPYVVPY